MAATGACDSIPPKAEALRELELAMVRATDVTMVVSDPEREQVERDVPGQGVIVVPTVHDVEPYVAAARGSLGNTLRRGLRAPSQRRRRGSPGEGRDAAGMARVARRAGDYRRPEPSARGRGARLAAGRCHWVGGGSSAAAGAVAADGGAAALRSGDEGQSHAVSGSWPPGRDDTVGAEGLDVPDGESMLIADEPDEIADRIVRPIATMICGSLSGRPSRSSRELLSGGVDRADRLLLGGATGLVGTVGPRTSPSLAPPGSSRDGASSRRRQLSGQRALEMMLSTNEEFTRRFEFVSFPPVHELPDTLVPELHRAVAEAMWSSRSASTTAIAMAWGWAPTLWPRSRERAPSCAGQASTGPGTSRISSTSGTRAGSLCSTPPSTITIAPFCGHTRREWTWRRHAYFWKMPSDHLTRSLGSKDNRRARRARSGLRRSGRFVHRLPVSG